MITTTLDLLATHPFLEGLPQPWLDRLSYQGKRAVHHPGHRFSTKVVGPTGSG
jgi:hypothetical protein